MESFQHVVRDELGIHARPAAKLVKEAKNFRSRIMVRCGDKEADATRLMAVMGMRIKKDMDVTVTASGADEADAIEAIKKFFQANL